MMTTIETVLKEFDRKFGRKSKGLESKGTYPAHWFIKENVKQGDIRDFLKQFLLKVEEETRKADIEIVKKLKHKGSCTELGCKMTHNNAVDDILDQLEKKE